MYLYICVYSRGDVSLVCKLQVNMSLRNVHLLLAITVGQTSFWHWSAGKPLWIY